MIKNKLERTGSGYIWPNPNAKNKYIYIYIYIYSKLSKFDGEINIHTAIVSIQDYKFHWLITAKLSSEEVGLHMIYIVIGLISKRLGCGVVKGWIRKRDANFMPR